MKKSLVLFLIFLDFVEEREFFFVSCVRVTIYQCIAIVNKDNHKIMLPSVVLVVRVVRWPFQLS